MLDKVAALLGIAMVCAVALGALWLTADRFFDRLEEAATPGPPEIDEEIPWLPYTPDRTSLDVDDLHEQVLAVEAELRGVTDFLHDVEYRALRDPGYSYDILLGAAGSVRIADPIDPDDLRALGFVVTRTHVQVPQTTYPITGPPPTRPSILAIRNGVRVETGTGEDGHGLTFHVRPTG